MVDINSCINIDNIDFSSNIRKIFKDNKQNIVKQWIIYPTLFDILKRFDISHDYYEQNVAAPVVEYFITIVEGVNKPGDCPVMRRVVDLFYEKGLSVEDVFLSCTAFKNVLHRTLLENKIEENTLSTLIMILDLNLSNILAIYSSKLEKKEEQLALHNSIMENHVLLTVTDPKGVITHVTDAFSELSGYSQEELVGKTHRIINDPEQDRDIFKRMWEVILSGKKWSGKFKNIKKNGEYFVVKTTILPIKDKDGNITEFMAVRDNITDREVFQYDQLTNVYTRRIFDEKFESLITTTKQENKSFSIVIADIDHFKNVNDTYGHQKGDEILASFTKVIQQNIRSNDMCFRWGGEEFILLLPMANLTIAYNVAQRIRGDFNKSIIIEGKAQSCSFGVTEFREDDTKESIFKRVDEALYRAKETGRNKVEVN